MTERLIDIEARIGGVRKLGTVVNAMRGIAAARSRQAQGQIEAVDAYARVLGRAIGRVLPFLSAASAKAAEPSGTRRSVVLFLAEEGFVGGYSERVLDALGAELLAGHLFLVGTRGTMIARERGIEPDWQAPMPAHTQSIPRLADRLAAAIYEAVRAEIFHELDVAFPVTGPAGAVEVRTVRLLPFDPTTFGASEGEGPPLVQLPWQTLLADMTGEYLHAQLCHAALHAFAAENQARMQAMAATRRQVDRMLQDLTVRQRILRQDEITAEIMELSAGESASVAAS